MTAPHGRPLTCFTNTAVLALARCEDGVRSAVELHQWEADELGDVRKMVCDVSAAAGVTCRMRPVGRAAQPVGGSTCVAVALVVAVRLLLSMSPCSELTSRQLANAAGPDVTSGTEVALRRRDRFEQHIRLETCDNGLCSTCVTCTGNSRTRTAARGSARVGDLATDMAWSVVLKSLRAVLLGTAGAVPTEEAANEGAAEAGNADVL